MCRKAAIREGSPCVENLLCMQKDLCSISCGHENLVFIFEGMKNCGHFLTLEKGGEQCGIVVTAEARVLIFFRPKGHISRGHMPSGAGGTSG